MSEDIRKGNSTTGSYVVSDLGHSFDEEIIRLHAQVELSWRTERRHLHSFGLSDGLRVLELGCGPGFITKKLVEWLPHSEIVALDVDRRMLIRAREIIGIPNHHVTLLETSADAIGLASNMFDVAISRYLFQHVSDPIATAAEIRRVLRPGGMHFIIDIDDGLWGIVQPEFPEFRIWHSHRAQAQAGRGGNRFIGRQLYRILQEAGYVHIETDLFGYHSDTLGVEAFTRQIDPNQLYHLVEANILSSEEYLRANALYHQFLRSSNRFVMMAGFIAYGEKPR